MSSFEIKRRFLLAALLMRYPTSVDYFDGSALAPPGIGSDPGSATATFHSEGRVRSGFVHFASARSSKDIVAIF